MIELCLIFLQCIATPIQTSHYAQGLMEHQVAYRLDIGDVTQEQVDRADAFAASGPCDMIGDVVYLGTDERIAEVLIVDCAGRNDPDTQEFMQYIAYELDYETHVDVFGCEPMRACSLYEWSEQ